MLTTVLNFDFKLTEKQEALPIMYWLPKMHKNLSVVDLSLHLKTAALSL